MKRNTASHTDEMTDEQFERDGINRDLDAIAAMIKQATGHDDVVLIEQAVRRVRQRVIRFARMMDDATFAMVMRPHDEPVDGDNVVRFRRNARR